MASGIEMIPMGRRVMKKEERVKGGWDGRPEKGEKRENERKRRIERDERGERRERERERID